MYRERTPRLVNLALVCTALVVVTLRFLPAIVKQNAYSTESLVLLSIFCVGCRASKQQRPSQARLLLPSQCSFLFPH